MIVAFGRADLLPLWPWDRSMAAAPKDCPRATVCTGGRTYFMTSAMANASVSNPTCWPVAVVVPDELMYIVIGSVVDS